MKIKDMVIIKMYNFNLDDINIIQLELHSICDLDCAFCPRQVSMKNIKHKFLDKKLVDYCIENLVFKAKNLKALKLSGFNNVIINKQMVDKLNLIIDKVKKHNPNIYISLCSAGTQTKNIDFYDVFNLKYDFQIFTLHRKQDFWYNDLIKELERKNIDYSVYYTNNYDIKAIKFNNKVCIFDHDYSIFDTLPLEDYDKIIKENNYTIYNVNNENTFMKKETTSCKNICKKNILKIDFEGYVMPCICSHSLIDNRLSYGKFEINDDNIIYIPNNNRSFEYCEFCQIKFLTDGDPVLDLNDYIKVDRM